MGKLRLDSNSSHEAVNESELLSDAFGFSTVPQYANFSQFSGWEGRRRRLGQRSRKGLRLLKNRAATGVPALSEHGFQ